MLVGAPFADPNGYDSGATYVVFGKAAGFGPSLELSALDGANGFRLIGAEAFDISGISLGAARDVNGDGFDDLLIGAIGAVPHGTHSGATYVVFGKAAGFGPNLDLSTLDGTNGFKLSGVDAFDYAGRSVSGAGDFNGDGFDDLIIGAAGFDFFGIHSGASYVVFGKASGFTPNLELSSLNGINGFKVSGLAVGDYLGDSVSSAGDVNGDGFDDILVGAPGAGPHGEHSGASYVIFGSFAAAVGISGGAVDEGDNAMSGIAFTVSLSAATTESIGVHYRTENGTAVAGSDFLGVTDELLTFSPGEISKTITIQVLGDTFHEVDETFSVVLSDPSYGAIIYAGVGVGTIFDDDAAPVVSIAGGSVVEGDNGTTGLTFTVSLSEASGLPTSLRLATADGTAQAGSDYMALTPGKLAFAPGETTKTITINVLGDTAIEDRETFSLLLSDPNGATIGEGTAIGTILNDDTALSIIGPAECLEGDSGIQPFVFTVTLEKASALPVTLGYAAVDGTATGGTDFSIPAIDAQVTFAPGETMKTITINVLGDTAIEDHETFSVLLSNASGAIISNGTATGTILNDDTALSIIGPAEGLEGDSATAPFVLLSVWRRHRRCP